MPPAYPTLTQSAQIEQSSLGVALIPWDPDRGWAADRSPTDTYDNQGCPPGYGTIYQDNGFGGLVKSCRLVATATEAQIRQDAAPGLVDQSIINIAAAAESVVQGAGQVVQTTGDVLSRMVATLGPWLAIAAIGYLLIVVPRPRR